MAKRLLLALLSILTAFSLSGCWNYRSLDQMSIVVGIAVDFDKETNTFDVSYEIANLSGKGKTSPITGKIIHAQGKTLFEAARNVKRRDQDKLFFGASCVLVLSHELVREVGILSLIEWFLRDAECRETMSVAISQEATAAEILQSPEESESIMSVTIYDILKEDKDVTGTIQNMQLYEIYNRLYSPRKSAVLPALHRVLNGKELVPEVNGAALIKGEQLVGFLPPEQSRYILLVEGQLNSAVMTLSTSDIPGHDLSLEVLKSKAEKNYAYEGGKLILTIESALEVALAENRIGLDVMDKDAVKQAEEAAARMIEGDILRLMGVLQHEFAADVFGFGEMIYKRNLPLWHQLAPSWEALYPAAEVRVSSTVHIVNAASAK
ncbi:MAG: Ger(x)C family spore germination protein [Candidatus Limiplasma sp.]|nr:Ger(x)C family spore germination protein [Candidatus Limiplasma sp.]